MPTGSRADPGEFTSDQALRRTILIRLSALFGVSLLPNLSGCDNDTDARAPAPISPPDPTHALPPTQTPDVRSEVSFESVATAARLDSRFAGLSYEKTKLAQPLFTGANTALIQLFNLLGPAVLRIGANAVDRSSWNAEAQGLTPILPAQIDALANFIQATQWQVIYAVNLAQNTPANAAREAAYVAERLGSSLIAWEIGNEPDLYRRHGYRPNTWGYNQFRAEWREFQAAMSAASPGVPFSGPGTSYDLERYTLSFGRDERFRLDMLTHHYYRADRNDPNSTLELLLEPHAALIEELNLLVQVASNEGIDLGVRLSEANSFYNGGVPNVSNAFGSALWAIDFMFHCAIAGCRGVNMHGGNRGSYTPIADRTGVVVEARPIYYGMMMFAQAANGLPLRGVVVSDTAINTGAWAVRRDDGGINAVLLNKDDSRSVGMNLNTGISADRFEQSWLRGTSLSASTGQTLGGAPIGPDGTWAPASEPLLAASVGQLSVVLPPASAVLIRSL